MSGRFSTTQYGDKMPTPAQARRTIERAFRKAHPDIAKTVEFAWQGRMGQWCPYAAPTRDCGSHFRIQFVQVAAPGYASRLFHLSQDSKTGKVVAT